LLAFALMSSSPEPLQATSASQAYNEGYNAGAKAYEDDKAPEEEEEEKGGCAEAAEGLNALNVSVFCLRSVGRRPTLLS